MIKLCSVWLYCIAARWWTPNPDEKHDEDQIASFILTFFYFSSYKLELIRDPISTLVVKEKNQERCCNSALGWHRTPSDCRTLFKLLHYGCGRHAPYTDHSSWRRSQAPLKNVKPHPECVKKKGCCQDQSAVRSHRGEQASLGLPGRGNQKGSRFAIRLR